MANYSDLLMSIVFFGDAYVKARKRNEAEKADRAYRKLQENIQQAQLEAANAKTKAIEQQEKKLAAEARSKAKGRGAIMGLAGGASSSDVLASLIQGPSLQKVTGEPKTSEAELPKIDQQLRGQMPLDTSTNLKAIERLRSGEGQRLQLAGPQIPRSEDKYGAFPSRQELAAPDLRRGVEVAEGRSKLAPEKKVEEDQYGIFPSWRESKVLAPETEPLLTPDQQRATQQTELAVGIGDKGNRVQSSVTLPDKTPTAKIPEIAVHQTARMFNESYTKAEQIDADMLEVLIPMLLGDETPKGFIVQGSKKDLAERYKKFNENLETKLITGPNGGQKIVTINKRTSKVLNETVLYPSEEDRPLSLEDYQSLVAEYGEKLATQIQPGITTQDEAFKMISKLEPSLKMKDLTHVSTLKDPFAGTMTHIYRKNDDPTGDIVKLTTPFVPPPIDSDTLSNFARVTGKSFAPSTTWQDIKKMGIMISPPILDNDRPMKGSEIQWWADNTGIKGLKPGMSRNKVIKMGNDQGITITAKELTPTFKSMFYDDQGYAFGLYLDPSGSVSHTERIMIPQPDGTKVHLRKPLTSDNESSDSSVAYNRFLTNRFRQLGSYDIQADQYGKLKSTFDDIIGILDGSKGSFNNQKELEGLVNNKRITFEPQTHTDKNGIKTTYWQLVRDRDLVENPKTINVHTQALIMLYNRLLDPLSTVRSEEFGRMALGLSVAEKAQGFWLNFTRGGAGIGLATIQAIKDSADGLFKDTITQYRGRTWPTINAAINYSDPESKLYYGEGYDINMFLDQSYMNMWTSAEHPINMSSNLEDWKKARDYWKNSTKITVPEGIPGTNQKDRKVNKTSWPGRAGGQQ